MKELTVDAAVENIETVTAFVMAELETLDCPVKAETQIAIAIDELFGNIARYAYSPDIGKATVRFEVDDDPTAVIITFIWNRWIPTHTPLRRSGRSAGWVSFWSEKPWTW